ncbi:MAG: hypothetical protein R6V35_03185 [Candidatus Nanohaloarchaea archaeon]
MAGRMKGSLEGVLPMTGLLILAAILSMQSLPIGEALASVTEESGEDIAALTEGQTVSENFMNNYMPAAMKYSANNAAYELEDGGINWKSEASTVSEPYRIVGSVVDAWESETTPRIDSRLSNHHCSIEHDLIMRVYPGESGNSLFTTDSIEEVEVEAFTFNPVKISCNSETEYINQTYSTEVTATNRYIELVKPASEFFYRVENENVKEDVKDKYEGSETECGSYDYDGAEEEAKEKYEDDTYDFSSIEDDLNIAEGINADMSSSDEYVGSSETSEGGQCNEYCDGEWVDIRPELGGGEYCDGTIVTEYDKTVDYTLTPTHTSIDFEASDPETEVIADGGYRNLNLEITDYQIDY